MDISCQRENLTGVREDSLVRRQDAFSHELNGSFLVNVGVTAVKYVISRIQQRFLEFFLRQWLVLAFLRRLGAFRFHIF